MSVDLHKYISGSEHQTYDGCTLTGTRYHQRLKYLKDQRSQDIGSVNLDLRPAVSRHFILLTTYLPLEHVSIIILQAYYSPAWIYHTIDETFFMIMNVWMNNTFFMFRDKLFHYLKHFGYCEFQGSPWLSLRKLWLTRQ